MDSSGPRQARIHPAVLSERGRRPLSTPLPRARKPADRAQELVLGRRAFANTWRLPAFAVEGVGSRHPDGGLEQQQRKAGWLARWRERRRSRSARAADISRRALQAERRNIDTVGKYGGGGGS
jgi:hypothetical protein